MKGYSCTPITWVSKERDEGVLYHCNMGFKERDEGVLYPCNMDFQREREMKGYCTLGSDCGLGTPRCPELF